MCIFPLQTLNLVTGLVETRWLNTVVQLRCKIYWIYLCDDTDNVAPMDIETSNGSIEFNFAMIMIMLFIEMCQRVCEEQK